MYVEQLYTGCLAEAAYYIESAGEAVIIDPLRETDPYLELASSRGAKIKYVLETHFHADFVSGHVDLAKKAGAQVVYGPNAETGYEAKIATDGEVLQVGDVTITVLHTPGHTLESTTYLLKDENGKEHAIFTGDTLFIGDVGRPDLAIKSDLTQDDLAGMLFDSLQNKIMSLPDDVIVYPAHGAGSACGKNMSEETFDTLGNQKATNYALQCKTKEEFVATVTEGILPPPQYFAKNAMLNKSGYESIDVVMERGTNSLTLDEFEALISDRVIILDTRSKGDFVTGHIPGSIFIGIDGSFATWVGALITDLKQPLLIVADTGRENEVVMRLARVGYDNALGYLEGGFATWKNAGKPVDSVESISAQELAARYKTGKLSVVDVRKPGEYDSEHVECAKHYALDYIQDNLNELDKDEPQYVHCRSGYRSVVAISILKNQGYTNLIDVAGGMQDILNTDIPVTDFACTDS